MARKKRRKPKQQTLSYIARLLADLEVELGMDREELMEALRNNEQYGIDFTERVEEKSIKVSNKAKLREALIDLVSKIRRNDKQ